MTSPAKLRQRLSRLREEYADLLELAFATSPLWRGRVHDLARRCGKPTCRCVKGDLHVSPVLEDRSGARTRNLTLHGEDLNLFRRLTETYRELRSARARLVRIQREMIEIFDALEAARRALGERRHAGRLSRRERKHQEGGG
jgi:uncharacterized protein with von Willebrand factor type A (vWA) domain